MAVPLVTRPSPSPDSSCADKSRLDDEVIGYGAGAIAVYTSSGEWGVVAVKEPDAITWFARLDRDTKRFVLKLLDGLHASHGDELVQARLNRILRTAYPSVQAYSAAVLAAFPKQS